MKKITRENYQNRERIVTDQLEPILERTVPGKMNYAVKAILIRLTPLRIGGKLPKAVTVGRGDTYSGQMVPVTRKMAEPGITDQVPVAVSCV